MKTYYIVAYKFGSSKIVAERETRKAAETLRKQYEARYPRVTFKVETD